MCMIDPHLDYGYEESSVVQKSTLTYYKIGVASKRIEVVKARDRKKLKVNILEKSWFSFYIAKLNKI